MSSSVSALDAKLAHLESNDLVVQIVAKNVRSIIKDLGIDKQVPGLQIYFPDFTDIALNSPKPVYYTEACSSILPSTVVVNARFLLDTEAAIRSLEYRYPPRAILAKWRACSGLSNVFVKTESLAQLRQFEGTESY
jgi:hypothetical protein